MNIFSKKKFLVSIILSACNLIAPSMAFAQGVEAGTIISNIAIVSYSVENTVQVPIESSPYGNTINGSDEGVETKFVVDRKIDLLVTGNTNANVNPGDTQAEVTFTLQNQGNGIQEFSLATDNLLTSDNFDINNCNIEVTSVTGSILAGEVIPSMGNIKLSPDQQADISVKCDVPENNLGSPILNGQTSLLGLIAKAEKNEDGTDVVEILTSEIASELDTVFVDGVGTDDKARDASHSSRRSYIAATSTADPELAINKTILSVVDPSGGNSAISGAEVTYMVQVSSTGIGSINNVVVTDKTPSEMIYKTNSIQLDNTNQTDISDVIDNSDFGVTTADTATINLGSFSAGDQFEILVTYIIN